VKYFFDLHIVTNCKPSYQRTTEQTIRCHLVPFFGNVDLRDIEVEDVEQYKALKAKTHAPKTVNNHLGVLSVALNRAVAWGYADLNPVARVRPLRLPPQEFTFWDQSQSEAFLEAITREDPAWFPFFLTALHTGMRLGELFALRWEDLDFPKRQLRVVRSVNRGDLTTPKSGRSRSIPMTERLRHTLKSARHLRGKLVFCRENGGYLSRDVVKHPFDRCTRKAGLPVIRLHDLRHSFASQLVMAGVPLLAVQQYLGHADLKMTMRYSHLSPQMRDGYIQRLDAPLAGQPGVATWSQFGPKA
jgi:integrase